jgi:hypothetical protein
MNRNTTRPFSEKVVFGGGFVASNVYVTGQSKACKRCGLYARQVLSVNIDLKTRPPRNTGVYSSETVRSYEFPHNALRCFRNILPPVASGRLLPVIPGI